MREATSESSLSLQESTSSRIARSRPRCITCAVIYIEARFREPISLEDIAGASHVSKFHFARVFRAELEMSPMQYVRWRRVQEAKRMLRAGRTPMAIIAMDLGYFDHSHFIRAFRSVTGMCPKEYICATSNLPTAVTDRRQNRA